MAEAPERSMRSGPVPGAPAHGVPDAETSEASAARMPAEMLKRRNFDNGDAEFLLFPISDFVVQVMYGDQTSYFGVGAVRDISEAYTHGTDATYLQMALRASLSTGTRPRMPR